jgi:protein-tyrosine phosphatase
LYRFALAPAGGVVLGLPHTYVRADVPTRERRRSMRSLLFTVLAGFVLFLVVGNAVMLSIHGLARQSADVDVLAPTGIRNFRQVNDHLWRGAAPSTQGYRSLAAAGVTTIVDLRAEEDLHVDEAMLAKLGVTRVHLPIRDGQAPPAERVRQFLDAVKDSPGRVYVHCGAGVGRTGSMVAAYLVATGQASPSAALKHNLSVGPPSLEQVTYMATMDAEFERPNAALTAASRVLDAPRRIWSRVNA